jgi:hypothetical protein
VDYRPGHALEKILLDGTMTLVVRLDADELIDAYVNGFNGLV